MPIDLIGEQVDLQALIHRKRSRVELSTELSFSGLETDKGILPEGEAGCSTREQRPGR